MRVQGGTGRLVAFLVVVGGVATCFLFGAWIFGLVPSPTSPTPAFQYVRTISISSPDYLAPVAVNGSGALYTKGDSSSIVVRNQDGTILHQWGSPGAADGQFSGPHGLAVNATGHLYVADDGNHRIQVFTATGEFLFKWNKSTGGSGCGDGEFNSPNDVAINAMGHVYVADTTNHRVQVFTQTGQFLCKWGKAGCASGTGDGEFDGPQGIAVDSTGNVYVADLGNKRIQVFDANGHFLRKWNVTSASERDMCDPRKIDLDSQGYVYVTDPGYDRVRVFTQAGSVVQDLGGVTFGDVFGIAADASGYVYVRDQDGPIHVFYNPAAEDPVEDWFIFMGGAVLVMMGGILSLVAVVRGVELFSRGSGAWKEKGPAPPLAACPLCHHEVPPGTVICPHCGRRLSENPL